MGFILSWFIVFRAMPNNVATPKDELIGKAKGSLAEVLIRPGCSYGDATTYSLDFEGEKISYMFIDTFQGLIMVHPSKKATHHIIAMTHARANVLNDQKDLVAVTTGNTKEN